MRTRQVLAIGAVVASLGLGTAACTSGHSDTAAPAGDATPAAGSGPALQRSYVTVVHKVLPSVVQITTDQGLGSGIVFDDKGDIVTNAHVVGRAKHFKVRLARNPSTVPAHLVGTYRPDDLAVIRLDSPPKNPHPAHFGDSSKLRVGDIVLAMGSPLGLTGSVTDGIVSATGRLVSEPQDKDSPGATLPDAIQTSASINPGNSGGALVDLSGDVIGIPTLAAVDQEAGGGSAAPGIGFAISSNLVTDIAGQLIKHDGHVVNSHRAALGVRVRSVLGSDGQPAGAGVHSVVSDGPADSAGIKAGAIITAVNKKPVRSVTDLTRVLAELNPDQKIPVAYTAPDGTDHTVTVTLGQLPGS